MAAVFLAITAVFQILGMRTKKGNKRHATYGLASFKLIFPGTISNVFTYIELAESLSHIFVSTYKGIEKVIP